MRSNQWASIDQLCATSANQRRLRWMDSITGERDGAGEDGEMVLVHK